MISEKTYPMGSVLAVSIIFAALILLVVCLKAYFRIRYFRTKYIRGTQSERIWSSQDKFDIKKDVATVQKRSDGDFVILGISDIFIRNPFRSSEKQALYNTIKDMIYRTDPDLIVLSLGNVFIFSRQCYIMITDVMERLAVPWTAIFENVGGDNADANELGDILSKGKYSLFQKGPRNLYGIGNYAAIVTKQDEPWKILLFSGAGDAEKRNEQTPPKPSFFAAHIHENGTSDTEGNAFYSYDQKQYAEWISSGVGNCCGRAVETTVITAKTIGRWHPIAEEATNVRD